MVCISPGAAARGPGYVFTRCRRIEAMTQPRSLAPQSATSRRDFLTPAAATAATASLLPAVHAAGSDVLKVGLVGCGGRGTGAAAQAANAGQGIKIVALADMFKDQIERTRKSLQKEL